MGQHYAWVEPFLAAMRESNGHVSHSCEAVKIQRSQAYRLRQKDTEFREAWDEITEKTVDAIERRAYSLAIEGWKEPVFGKTEDGTIGQIGEKRKFSPSLLIFLLKQRRPTDYNKAIGTKEVAGGEPMDLEIALHTIGAEIGRAMGGAPPLELTPEELQGFAEEGGEGD